MERRLDPRRIIRYQWCSSKKRFFRGTKSVVAEVKATERAIEVLRRVRAERSGELTIPIDSCRCDGTAPHLYENYVLPYGAVEIGRVEDIPVYIAPHFADAWKNVQATLDVVDDPAADALSLETAYGVRLVLRE